MSFKLSIITPCSSKYQYALRAQAVAVKANLTAAGIASGDYILVTCEKPAEGILAQLRGILGSLFNVHHIPLPVSEGERKDYKVNAQLLIAQMFDAGFAKARSLGADCVWTLESDVIPEANNLRCMLDMLAFDGGYFSVSFCPYISSGGGGIMGGRGTANNWILPTVYEEEKDAAGHPSGNVFSLNAKGWRRRGWLEWAYPALGKGSIVPSDWFPMGNNVFSRKAVDLVNFNGYCGRGTQDLWLSYKLASYGLKFCVIPHSVSSHIARKQNTDGGEFTRYELFHESEGECVGHLRQRELPFYDHTPGETAPEPPPEDFQI